MNEPFPTVDGALLDSLLNLMDCEFYAFYPREGQENKSQEDIDQCGPTHGGHLLFCLHLERVCCSVRRPALGEVELRVDGVAWSHLHESSPSS